MLGEKNPNQDILFHLGESIVTNLLVIRGKFNRVVFCIYGKLAEDEGRLLHRQEA